MAIGTKVCRVCGKEYEACHTLRPNLNNEFRWQDVACCVEHGAIYFEKVMKARGIATQTENSPAASEPKTAKRSKAKKADRETDDGQESVVKEKSE